MDSVVVIRGTDEEDLVDIEGVSGEEAADDKKFQIAKTWDVADKTNSELDTPFCRNSLQKTTKTVTAQCNVEKEFSDWWKSASDFQRPVKTCDENFKVDAPKNELDPILQQPTQQDINPFGKL